MGDHWRNFLYDWINDFMNYSQKCFEKYSCVLLFFLSKRLYEYYWQRPARFVHFLANSSEQT